MPHLASFRDFLKTGNLGPLTPALDLRATSDVLGPPGDWAYISNEDVFPLYWMYEGGLGCRLEINFEPSPPHAMQWFQIDGAEGLRQDVHVFGDQLALAMDGFHGRSRPSELLSSRVRENETVLLQFDPKDMMLVVSAGTVQIIFEMDSGDEDIPDAERRAMLADAFGTNRCFAEIERHYRMPGLYAFPRREAAPWPERPGQLSCAGDRYLASLEGEAPSPAFLSEPGISTT
ncbi:hypothetical protein [Aquibium sp. ELW1220]|uniref:hypothetical protein n=1 Tax=Aquibium sp. ELW1220 TaxID=2976766 RepID=UPI0025B17009|nr:hypothetical protein [Aquibium sp. ELW1220]MDN2583471.1 hypothetical protein [Aquibium sp. ELW1220]